MEDIRVAAQKPNGRKRWKMPSFNRLCPPDPQNGSNCAVLLKPHLKVA